MIKLAVDERIRDEGCDSLRRSIWEAKIAQAREEAWKDGYQEGLSDGNELGYNRAKKDFLTIVLDFTKGNRS